MASRFQQTGELVCERCGMPRAIADAGEDRCVTESDFASDGYPEPVGTHERWVLVTPPTAPTILPMGVLLAEREREMAVIAEQEDFNLRTIREAFMLCFHCGANMTPQSAVVVIVGHASELRCVPCASGMAVAS